MVEYTNALDAVPNFMTKGRSDQIHNVLQTMDAPTRSLIRKYYNSENAQ